MTSTLGCSMLGGLWYKGGILSVNIGELCRRSFGRCFGFRDRHEICFPNEIYRTKILYSYHKQSFMTAGKNYYYPGPAIFSEEFVRDHYFLFVLKGKISCYDGFKK